MRFASASNPKWSKTLAFPICIMRLDSYGVTTLEYFALTFEVNPSREIKEEDVLVKFINESYHIENDYAYYLDMVKFETVPEYIVKAIDDYMERTYSKA